MAEYQGATDQVHQITLDSAISQAMWDRTAASAGQRVGVQVYTHFVGSGSDIRISVHNRSGRRLDRIEGKVYGDRFKVMYTVSDRAEDAIYFEANLRRHGLKKESEEMIIIPPIEITNVQWSQEEARRGDVLQLSADVSDVPDGTEAVIEIYEHDDDGAHDFITRLSTLVDDSKVEIQWEYVYHEDTDEIPTTEETERGYNPPEYFFKVIIYGQEAESGRLEFKDWIEFTIDDTQGNPQANADYILHMPDGQERRGTLDDQGYAREEDVPPGPCRIELPDPDFTDSGSSQEGDSSSTQESDSNTTQQQS